MPSILYTTFLNETIFYHNDNKCNDNRNSSKEVKEVILLPRSRAMKSWKNKKHDDMIKPSVSFSFSMITSTHDMSN